MGIRLLVLGADGQLGHCLSTHAKPALTETLDDLVCYGKDKVDFTNPDQVVNALKDVRPDVVINAAAYTQVDQAEDDPETAMAVNAKAVGALAEQAKKQDVVLVHYSTDYVFDGQKTTPYTEHDEPAPLNAYGRSKLEGERFLEQVGGQWVCFRTGWVYSNRGKNFCKTMIEKARTAVAPLEVVADQTGAPTPAPWLAELGLSIAGVRVQEKYRVLGRLAPTFLPDFPPEIPGGEIFHASAAGGITWYDYALASLEWAEKRGLIPKMPEMKKSDSASMGYKAKRPAYSVLDCSKLKETFKLNPPDWTRGVRNLILNLDESSTS